MSIYNPNSNGGALKQPIQYKPSHAFSVSNRKREMPSKFIENNAHITVSVVHEQNENTAPRRSKPTDRVALPTVKKGLKGRKSMRSLSFSAVQRAHERMDGMQALKFLHPRRLRKAVIEKTIPDGTFTPSV